MYGLHQLLLHSDSGQVIVRGQSMWCNDNAYKPLAARTVSMTLKKHADEFGLEHDNHIQNALGKRVNGFWGIEALAAPPVL